MLLNRKKAMFLRGAVKDWRRSGALTASQSDKLLDTIEVAPFDWRRLAKYSFWIAIICIMISVGAALSDHALMLLLAQVFNAPDIAKCVFFTAVAGGLYTYGAQRRAAKPQKMYSNEALLFLGVLSTAGAIAFFGKVMDTGNHHFSILLLMSFFIYGALGLYLRSILVWVFALLSLGSWFGTETGYYSGWGAYYLGMNYPMRFVGFGLVLTMASYLLLEHKRLKPFFKSTYIMGMLYLFISLWIMSIFGNYGDMNSWYHVKQYELYYWSFLFGLGSVAAIVHGLKFDNAISRGFGITFLFINLYTRFFEYFWDHMHKAIFFGFCAAGFWFIGANAEKIWNMGLHRLHRLPRRARAR